MFTSKSCTYVQEKEVKFKLLIINDLKPNFINVNQNKTNLKQIIIWFFNFFETQGRKKRNKSKPSPDCQLFFQLFLYKDSKDNKCLLIWTCPLLSPIFQKNKYFRFMMNSGDHDMLVSFLSTQAWIRSMNYSIIDDWRPWMTNNQVAGYIILCVFVLLFIYYLLYLYPTTFFFMFVRYTRTYANKMTFATLKASLLVSS